MRVVLALAAILLCAGLAAAGTLQWFSGYVAAPGPLPAGKIIFIAPGTGVKGIAAQLETENAIGNRYAFLAYVKLLGPKNTLKAGEYEIAPHMPLAALAEKIAKGQVYVRKVTIAEGLSGYDVMRLLNDAGSLQGQIETPPAEGSILPDTYAYTRNDSREKLLATMQAAQQKTIAALWPKRAQNLPFTTAGQAVSLASIVEKETGIASERARIAGVFANRLRLGMRLQSDPTVIYAITKGRQKLERVLYEHLEVDSPYNTYKYAGIPPLPICNPGKAALEATLNPEPHDFLYFVADGTGGHVFARTLAEHEANVAKWRAVQRAARNTGQ